MLYQGVKAFEIFTGKTAPIEIMRKVLAKAHAKPQNIALVGLMGSGKSTVAKLIAKETNLKLIDVDQNIETINGTKIKDIFEIHGETKFRELEKEEMSKIAHAQNSVISCGGRCNFGHRKCRKTKKTLFGFFGFYTKPETIVNRTIGDQSRPLVNFPDKLGILRKVMKNRLGLYAEACDVIISTQDKLPQEVTTQIICEAINLGLIKGVKNE